MCHALVIEDDPFIAMQIEDVLLGGGAGSVAIAATERDAIASAGACPPKFIASDVRLLEGTGPDAVAAILAMLGSIPVVFITASPEACDAFRGRADILVKPANLARLLAAFHRDVPECDRQAMPRA